MNNVLGSVSGVCVEDLLKDLSAKQHGLETLKKRMKSVNEKKQPLDLPLPKPHADQVCRFTLHVIMLSYYTCVPILH